MFAVTGHPCHDDGRTQWKNHVSYRQTESVPKVVFRLDPFVKVVDRPMSYVAISALIEGSDLIRVQRQLLLLCPVVDENKPLPRLPQQGLSLPCQRVFLSMVLSTDPQHPRQDPLRLDPSVGVSQHPRKLKLRRDSRDGVPLLLGPVSQHLVPRRLDDVVRRRRPGRVGLVDVSLQFSPERVDLANGLVQAGARVYLLAALDSLPILNGLLVVTLDFGDLCQGKERELALYVLLGAVVVFVARGADFNQFAGDFLALRNKVAVRPDPPQKLRHGNKLSLVDRHHRRPLEFFPTHAVVILCLGLLVVYLPREFLEFLPHKELDVTHELLLAEPPTVRPRPQIVVKPFGVALLVLSGVGLHKRLALVPGVMHHAFHVTVALDSAA
mmetsp:Transcript_13766/g.30049  ORF Transcript_13766/g.30049 Transcript_13766/m.30049 type:complete len:383 (-) Transcript_13766:372-1520(-)